MKKDNRYSDIKLKDKAITKCMLNFNLPFSIKKFFCLFNRISDYRYNNQFKQHYNVLNDLHNIHRGERCFVVGMGPSLDKTRFDLIKDEHFIVSNNFYQGIDKFKIKPEYWCVADNAIFDIHYKQLLNLDTKLFLTEDATKIFLKHRNYYMNGTTKEPIVIKPLGNTATWLKFSKDLRNGAYGGMVIWSSLQVAYHLGFKEIYLLGCDCSAKKGSVHFGGADSFNVFNKVDDEWEDTFNRYKIYKKLFEKEGRKIYNATVGGNLEVFERKNVEDMI